MSINIFEELEYQIYCALTFESTGRARLVIPIKTQEIKEMTPFFAEYGLSDSLEQIENSELNKEYNERM